MADASPALPRPMPTLYDASLSTLPSQQGWLSFGTGGTGTQTRSPNGTLLNSTAAMADAAGYSNHRPTAPATLVNSAFPRLDRSVGFSLDFRVRLISETHQATNRAGFSVTLLDQGSTPQGIELGFWTNSIFSQKGGSTPFQSVSETRNGVDTTVATTYSLRMLDQNYYLLAGNRLVLSGSVQDYSRATKPALLPYNPYQTPNFLFLGDNTSSASANVELGNVTLDVARTGTSGADTFAGTSSADMFNGLAGSDALNGASANDWLAGGAGTDTLNGGAGDDVLIGGGDADTFLFSSGAAFNTSQLGVDTIVDFDPSLDRIRLSRATFTALPASSSLGASSFAVVSSDAAAAASSAAIVYNNTTGNLFYNPNLGSAGFASTAGGGGVFAQLWGAPNGTVFPTLTNAAFVVVA